MRASLPLVDSRVSIAKREIIRRLSQVLPGLIDDTNTRLGLTGSDMIVKPKGYHSGPVPMADKYLNSIIVTHSVQKVTHGPGVFRNDVTITIYTIEQRIEVEKQIGPGEDRAALIFAALYPFLTGCYDASSRSCWRLLEPQEETPLPDQLSEFSGTACHFRLVQDPTYDNWI